MINAIDNATSKETRRAPERELTASELDQVCGGEKRSTAQKVSAVSESLTLSYGEIKFEYTAQRS